MYVYRENKDTSLIKDTFTFLIKNSSFMQFNLLKYKMPHMDTKLARTSASVSKVRYLIVSHSILSQSLFLSVAQNFPHDFVENI